MSRSEIKRSARAQLGGRIFDEAWLIAVLAELIYTAIVGASGSVLVAVGTLIMVGPMSYGMAYMFLRQMRTGEKMNIGDLFKGFADDFVQTTLIGLMSALYIALWSLLFVIPGVVKGYSYAFAEYIKVDNPTYKWKECLQASTEMMRGNRMRLFMLDLSFIGWYFVGSLCFGIGTLWVSAYHTAAKTRFYEELKGGRAYVAWEFPA